MKITVENHVIWIQFNIHIILFYNLINECNIHKYIYLFDINSYRSTINLHPIKLIFYGIKLLDELYNMNSFDHQNKPKKAELDRSGDNPVLFFRPVCVNVKNVSNYGERVWVQGTLMSPDNKEASTWTVK